MNLLVKSSRFYKKIIFLKIYCFFSFRKNSGYLVKLRSPKSVGNKLKEVTKMIKKLQTPLTEEAVRSLKAGDEVEITGTIYAARDMAHKRMCNALKIGEKLPFELKGAVIYFVGPTPARPGRVIGAAGPTTSGRMDAFSPILIAAGLKVMIGKGYRNQAVRDACKKYGAVHLSVVGGAGALLSKYIMSNKIIGYEDLTTEAIREFVVKDLPAIVAYDSRGGSVYEENIKNKR